jgi:Haem-binding domain
MSDNAKFWRQPLLSMCFGVSFSAAMLLVGCSSGSNSTAIEPGSAPTDSLAASPEAYGILKNSCFDCHSDRGSGSWSAKFAPSYLFGAHKARKVLNFSNWATLDVKQRKAMASAIAAVVDSGSMPPGDYDFFHASAKLSDEQKRLMLQWTTQQIALSAHMRRVSHTNMDAVLCSANPLESRQFQLARPPLTKR